MRKIRIAIGSDDGKNIIDDHFGESKSFLIFDVFEDGEHKFVEERENRSPEEEGKHGSDKKRGSVLNILGDCDAIVAGKMSPNFLKIRDSSKVQPIISKIDDINSFMREFFRNFDDFFILVEKRRNGEYPQQIPVIESL